MADTTNDLLTFIEKAVRNYKYPNSVGNNLRHSVKTIDQVLQEDERQSLELIQKRADDIVNRIDIKTPNKYSASSLMTFKSRLLRVIDDYNRYGKEASKMAAWSPKIAKKSMKDESKKSKQSGQIHEESEVIDVGARKFIEAISSPSASQSSIMTFDSTGSFRELNKSEVFIREGLKISLELPSDLTRREANKLKQFIDVMAMEDEAN